MKLQNRKTGEIVELLAKPSFVKRDKENYLASEVICFDSLAELNAEWEDYEEPKGYWFIDCAAPYPVDFCEFNEDTEDDKKIGNYFETKEEAEKAVEKLKAWKRLKDKGIEFYGWRKNPTGTYDFLARWEDIPPKMADIINDLDLLFCTEEDS